MNNRISFIYFGENQDDFGECINEIEKNDDLKTCVLFLSKHGFTDVTFSTYLEQSEFKKKLSLLFNKNAISEEHILCVDSEIIRQAFHKGFICGFNKSKKN